MSIQNNFPTIKPTLLLDFANTEQLDPRITFTRASTATYYGTQTAKAEENLVLQSQTFDAASWPPNGATVTANTSTAPDGTSTADKLVETAVTSDHNVPQSVATVSGATYTFSCFVKAAERGFAFLRANNSTFDAVSVNLTTGSASLANGSPASIVSTASVDGWWRVSFSFVASTASTFVLIQTSTDGVWANRQYTGTAGSGILIWGAQVEQRSTATAYTPTTTAPITNYIPQMLTAASGVPRFDHNPITFESLGLEIEEQRTNLLTYSEQFDDAAWTKTNATITANTIVAPDGTLTGDKLVANNGIAGYVEQSTSYTAGMTYVWSFYAKAAERNSVMFLVYGTNFGGSNIGRTFTLTGDGSVGSLSGTVPPTAATITPVGNGWYRCTLTAVCVTTHTGASFQIRDAVVGDGVSGRFIWGAQLEAGAFATSYIPTVASQVTRAADLAAMKGTNFSSWYNQTAGTIYAEAALVSNSGNRVYLDVGPNGAFGTTAYIVQTSSAISLAPATAPVNMTSSVNTTSLNNKVAAALETNNSLVAANGALGTVDTNCAMPVSATQLVIGNAVWSGGGTQLNGHIRRIAYYPMRVTNAQLQGLTS